MTHPRPDGPVRSLPRIGGLVLALVVSVVGVCLILFSRDTRLLRVGVIVGLWGLLIGAYAGYERRRPHGREREPEASDGRRDVELRYTYEVEPEHDVAADHRSYELQLELMLRRELERGLRADIAVLRDDVAGLRGEVLDAVDGRLRLERIETTRIHGSDLAALQDNIHRLADQGDAPAGAPAISGAHIAREQPPSAEYVGRRRAKTDPTSSSAHAAEGDG